MEEKINPMREIKLDKIVLSVGATGEELAKGVKLLGLLTGKKPKKTTSKKRIPGFNVRPGLEVGAVVTLRKDIDATLRKMLVAINNTLDKKQVTTNSFSFGVQEYIEVPGMEYQRDLGIMGFDVTVVFKRTGRRVSLRKQKKGKIPQKQRISSEEIIKFMEKNFRINFK